ncbi:SDR family NAD(P)-dependent oxidoreductase [Streptomyces albipurpureus]|uniref:SDR family NAD(P)-dependent oxidoreductase n=1 Tax=Streptomyces albipurpureus TaxID=2897419 RepID=A0ABT0UHD9_9ACTN|nr:SDR family NAD(P)-dependent oxidoreductase [Streptomyces sp. CWNU-1]MCM2387591.1 SDR family NAD(P)-dependent oxidoreductase [Streptomyces sp. CWNU-1]
MGSLDGRVAVVTGAGAGLGREHALLLAAEGAAVVVNDLGEAAHGAVEAIRAAGGEAVAHTESIADWSGAESLVKTAVETFGDLHIVVNNAGILRDRLLVSMTEAEFDAVIAVHLKGTFAVTRHAAAYWREQAKAGVTADRSLINTTSSSGLHGNVGQVNYGAAKAGIAALTLIAAEELERYHVRANAVAPGARTQMTESTPGLGEIMTSTVGAEFDTWHPGNVSPVVAMLAAADCRFTGQVLRVIGGQVDFYQGWSPAQTFTADHRWGIEELAEATAAVPAKPAKVAVGAQRAVQQS